MTVTREMPDRELITKGTEILFKELGYVDTVRFLSMPRGQRDESVDRHRKWQKCLVTYR
ncbi:hypothetical protein [Desulfonatronovibrio magnus]|uniref:hypothetical protein n=1 Tax=Desulfonatronovibrio magnus TaxID=698827 RepID=UPI0018DD944A|nr:hypothetical protein [Desulfonatronovibrio magnus]